MTVQRVVDRASGCHDVFNFVDTFIFTQSRTTLRPTSTGTPFVV